MTTPFIRFTLALQALYLIIVLFSLISISQPYYLAVQILFYIFNAAYLVVYLAFEIKHWYNKKIEPKAISYIRTISTTVVVSLIFSVFSGYHSFNSFYSYNVKSHLFLFVSNMLMFMTKTKVIFGVRGEVGQALSFVMVLFFMGVIIIYFQDHTA